MSYSIQAPDSVSPDSGYPLWLFLHGAWSTAEQAAPLFADAADAHGAILLAPQATRPCGDGFCWSFARDAQAIQQLLVTVQTTYSIDTKRISIIGYSMGCTIGLWLLAQETGTFAVFAALGMGSAFEPWEHDDGGIDEVGLRQSATRTRILLAVDQEDPGTNNLYFDDNYRRLRQAGFDVTTFRPRQATHAVTDEMRAMTIDMLTS